MSRSPYGGTDEGAARSLAVIGAGPAGLAAALAAAVRGSRVTLIDTGPQAGGQFYRQPAEELGARRPQALHHQWRTWERLRDGLAAQITTGRITHLTDHHVWCVEGLDDRSGFLVHALHGPAQEEPSVVRADAVILATGAYEKVLPFPGWTLPGVITAGGAQAMLKGGLVLQGRTAVVAGTGPLLLPVAAGLAAAGAEVAALVESAGAQDVARHARTFAAHPDKLVEGAGYVAELMRRRVRLKTRHTIVAAHGDGVLEAVTVAALDRDGRVAAGSEQVIRCDTLAVGHGLLPHTDLAETLGCRLEGTAVAVDDEQRTDVHGCGPRARPPAWAAPPSRSPRAISRGAPPRHASRGANPTRARGRPPPRPVRRAGSSAPPSTPHSRRVRTGPSRSPTTPSYAAARRCRPPRSVRRSASSGPRTRAP